MSDVFASTRSLCYNGRSLDLDSRHITARKCSASGFNVSGQSFIEEGQPKDHDATVSVLLLFRLSKVAV
jgi:hypothetical protein